MVNDHILKLIIKFLGQFLFFFNVNSLSQVKTDKIYMDITSS